ncbi:hypothetical protein CEXT_800431 [Caerostris extrusa]|uniref:Uncharacterized protein n=1 Tax=Caerostris extrusa TaxID=172846 RepID=A0AAV4RCT5_CAEEX|nr:hypothetical protein CEXT_800431 [Caerostris extrusa]
MICIAGGLNPDPKLRCIALTSVDIRKYIALQVTSILEDDFHYKRFKSIPEVLFTKMNGYSGNSERIINEKKIKITNTSDARNKQKERALEIA